MEKFPLFADYTRCDNIRVNVHVMFVKSKHFSQLINLHECIDARTNNSVHNNEILNTEQFYIRKVSNLQLEIKKYKSTN